jgi:hypothetical protein
MSNNKVPRKQTTEYPPPYARAATHHAGLRGDLLRLVSGTGGAGCARAGPAGVRVRVAGSAEALRFQSLIPRRRVQRHGVLAPAGAEPRPAAGSVHSRGVAQRAAHGPRAGPCAAFTCPPRMSLPMDHRYLPTYGMLGRTIDTDRRPGCNGRLSSLHGSRVAGKSRACGLRSQPPRPRWGRTPAPSLPPPPTASRISHLSSLIPGRASDGRGHPRPGAGWQPWHDTAAGLGADRCVMVVGLPEHSRRLRRRHPSPEGGGWSEGEGEPNIKAAACDACQLTRGRAGAGTGACCTDGQPAGGVGWQGLLGGGWLGCASVQRDSRRRAARGGAARCAAAAGAAAGLAARRLAGAA